MALLKTIRQNDGVTTSYHRILYTESMINSHNSIVVVSYVDKDARDSETVERVPYKKAITYEKDYEENMTIQDAYSYLKSLPEFKNAEDV